MRWYIDGRMLYEINKEALRAQTNSTGALQPFVCVTQQPGWEASWASCRRGRLRCRQPSTALPLAAAGYTVGERFIPLEPMHIIFNLAMSSECTQSAPSMPALSVSARAAAAAATCAATAIGRVVRPTDRTPATCRLPPACHPADSFSTVDLAQLQFPAQYKVGGGAMPQTAALPSAGAQKPAALTRITPHCSFQPRCPPALPPLQLDYVRVYQKKDALNVGCSPPDYPSAQYLAW